MNKKRTSPRHENTSGVERVLLQMARRGEDWAGKATSFSGPAEFHFDNLGDLFNWLKKRAKRQAD